MSKKTRDVRELAARALCRFHGVPANIQFQGRPMWKSFLREADVVLGAIGWKPEDEEARGGVVKPPEHQSRRKNAPPAETSGATKPSH
jgi:hypothetical protein